MSATDRTTAAPPAGPDDGRELVERLSVPGRPWFVAGIAGTLVLLLTAALWVAAAIAPVHEVEDRLTFPAGVRRVVLGTDVGDVTVLPATAGVVEVERRRVGTLRLPSAGVERRGDVVRLSGRCGWPRAWPVGAERRCRLGFALRVPPGVAVELDTGAGDVEVRQVTGDVTATTGSGDVTAAGVTGAVTLRAGSGSLDATAVRGPVARFRAGSGDVTLQDLDVREVTARTGSGRVDAGFAVAPDQVEATTGSGDVTVTVPPGEGYAVSLDTGSGRQTIAVPADAGSGRRLVLTSGAGDVTVRHP